MEFFRIEAPSKKIINPKTKTKSICRRDTRLWFLLLLAVTLYSVIWIPTSLRIRGIESKYQPRGQVEGDLLGLRPSHRTKLVTDTSSTSSSSDASIANNVQQPLSRSGERDANTSFHRAESGEKAFLSYRLEYDKPYKVTYGPHTQCAIGVKGNKFGRKKIRRVGLSNQLTEILNVTAYLRTNLKIITVGDSVAMQFHQVLEEALKPPLSTSIGLDTVQNETYRTIYQYAWPGAESVSVSAPVFGGGALAGLRMTGLFLEEGRGNPPPNIGPNVTDASGGWLPEHVQQILDHNFTAPSTDGVETTTKKTTQSFDVMIFRIPHGWLPASSITRERLEASLRFSQDMFGVHTIIIQTLFLNNNVKTMDDLNDMRNTNRIIRDLVQDSWGNQDIPDLLLMDFGGWTDQLIELNARLAGMDTKSNANYTLERLGCAKFPPSIAMSCVDKFVKPGSCKCTRNVISIDGMHWCMETIGGRVIGALSCLLQCSLLTNDGEVVIDMSSGTKQRVLGNCQQRCNGEFMSLNEASTLTNNIAAGLEIG